MDGWKQGGTRKRRRGGSCYLLDKHGRRAEMRQAGCIKDKSRDPQPGRMRETERFVRSQEHLEVAKLGATMLK